MTYDFLVDTYETEVEKVLSVWAMFNDEDMFTRPHPEDGRGRNLLEQMVHQCVSENFWFSTMLGIHVTDTPVPVRELRLEFMHIYANHAGQRLARLGILSEDWWQGVVPFFEVPRSRAWVMTRRIAHTAHHRGQQTTLLRQINRPLHSTYGPTADTGGLMQHQAPVIYADPDSATLLREEHGLRSRRGTAPSARPSRHGAPLEFPEYIT